MEEEVQIRRIMLKNAKKKVLLCDRSKYGQEYPYRLCRAGDVDEVVTEG
jgi:DeoR family glycerol-3-phosphate regulon repressor